RIPDEWERVILEAVRGVGRYDVLRDGENEAFEVVFIGLNKVVLKPSRYWESDLYISNNCKKGMEYKFSSVSCGPLDGEIGKYIIIAKCKGRVYSAVLCYDEFVNA